VGTLEAFSDAQGPGIGEPAADPTALSPRRPLVAAGLALLFPGAGHAYARRGATAVVLAAGVLACLVGLVLSRDTPFALHAVFASGFAILACDSVGAMLAVRGGAGAPAGLGSQLARGLVLLIVAGAAGTATAAIAQIPAWMRTGDVGRLVVTCGDHTLTVENRTETSVTALVEKLMMAPGPYPMSLGGPSSLSLEAHARDSVRFDVPEWVARRCSPGEGEPAGSCRVAFVLSFSLPDAPDAPSVRRIGFCDLDWRASQSNVPATLHVPDGQ
jgi:hypothetical protein